MTPGTALITGASRRLGAAMAEGLAARGWHVILHCHGSEEEAAAVRANIVADGGAADIVSLDLSDSAAIPGLADQVAQQWPDWRLLINSAALFEPDSAWGFDPAIWSRAAAVNLIAPVLLSEAFVRATSGRGERRIINLLDQKLANPNPDYFAYTLTKAALGMAAEMMAMAAPDDVRLFNLAPGLTLPSGDQSAEEFARAATLNLLERATGAGAIADAAAFLATAPLANGQTLFVDSGQHLVPQSRDVMFLVRGES